MNARNLFDERVQSIRREGDPWVEIDSSVTVIGLLGLHSLALVVILLQEFGVPIPVQVSAPIVFLALTYAPGGLVTLLLFRDVRLRLTHLLYAFGVSLIALMAIGLVLNIGLPLIGYTTPMARFPLAAGVTGFNLLLAVSLLRRRQRGSVRIRLLPLVSPTPLAFLLLPLLSIIGVGILNRTDNTFLLILVLVAVALVPLFVVVRRISETWHALGVWSISLAVLYHKSLWKYWGFRGQPYGIRTWKAKLWTPGLVDPGLLSAELLPNGILFPLYARLTGTHILTQYSVINPMFVSFIPVALFVTFRQYTDSHKAFLGASLFVFAHPFFRQYPTAGRAATPVLFLALFSVAISDRDSLPVVAVGLSLLFVLGIVVSHYGTSYYLMVTFGLALVVLVVLRRVENLIKRDTIGRPFDSTSASEALLTGLPRRLSLSLVLFYSVATLTWYMYMHHGRKFALLPKHAKTSYLQLIGGSTFSGRTAARLQKNYGTESIQFSKYLYLLISLLIGLGLLVVLYRRLSNKPTGFSEHYYALAVAILGIFGMTVLVRNWGGGRPMMITFVFTTIFAVVGLTAVESYTLKREREAIQVFCVLLAVLFILNSGVASALFLGGFAPSNVPNQNELAENSAPRAQTIVNKETDIAAHAWLIDHHEQLEVYGDTFANRQNDWYRPEINSRTREAGWESIEGKPLELPTLARPGIESGYVLLLGHNLKLDGVWSHQYGPKAASLDELELSQRSKVYTSGKSAVYYYNDSALY